MNTHLMDTILELARRERERWDDPEFDHPPGTLTNEATGGAPAAATAEPGEGGEPEGGEGEPGQEPAPLTRDEFEERFTQFGDELGQMLQQGTGQQQQEGDGGEPQQPDYQQIADEFIDRVNAGEEITPEYLERYTAAVAEQRASQMLEQRLPQALEQALGPVYDRFIQQDADKIEEKYPQLKEPETQKAVIQEAIQRAYQLGLDPGIVRSNPAFVEETWLLKCAREGTAPVPASGNDAALEAATAAGAASGQQEEESASARFARIAAAGDGGGLFDGAFGQ